MPTLLTWSDRGAAVPLDHHVQRPRGDRGPVLRLLDVSPPSRYERVIVLVPEGGLPGARQLSEEATADGREVELRVVPVADPSDYTELFEAVSPVVERLRGAGPIDVLLSAGTPQAQTIWVILVEAGLLPARMLQIIPARFVPVPHPHPVREVHLPIDGFPEIRALRAEVDRLRAGEQARQIGMIGNSEPMRALVARLARVAPSDLPVLVQGETGTGKELVARALHQGSRRTKGPFIACNGGALDDGVLASELFGHEAGAFTGAASRRRGLFELAHKGTLFLDEVGELSARVQVGLLRVLQEGELRRVGGEQAVRVDVRIIAATHRDLKQLVRAGTFREDLYFRLSIASLQLPPLRDRVEDLPAIVTHFLEETGRSDLVVTPEAWKQLVRYRWPGNVRELRAEVLRWTVFADRRVDPSDLSPEIRGTESHGRETLLGGEEQRPGTLADAIDRAEREAVSAAWAASGGNVSATARTLGVDRNTAKRKLKNLGIRS